MPSAVKPQRPALPQPLAALSAHLKRRRLRNELTTSVRAQEPASPLRSEPE